ncbi:MAG: PAS domain S-box protein [Chitinophagaceae bacterium]|nr:PAS domain S-box protein [Chitinophagaceae bacterium]
MLNYINQDQRDKIMSSKGVIKTENNRSSSIHHAANLPEETSEDQQRTLNEISDYKYALDQSSIVAITDQKGIINHVNDNFCKISKYSREELLGQDHRIINSGYHSEEFIKDLWVTIANGEIWRGELKNRAKDGTFYWVDTTIVPFLDEKEKPYQYIAIRSDITSSKKLEEEQALFASIVNYSDDAILSKTLGGVITSWNQGAEKIFGYTSAEIIGQHITMLIPNYYWSEEYEIIEKIRKGKVIDHYETQRIRKDGTLIHVSLTISPLKDSSGNITGASKIVRDITKQKKAEQQLSNSIKEITDYKFALDESSIVAITDQKGIIQHANDNFCKISKYNREELIGQDHRIINSGYHSKEFIKDLWTTIVNGKIWKGELNNRAKDGTVYWVDTTIVPFLHTDGKPYQYLALRTDITEKKKESEERLRLSYIIEATSGFVVIADMNQRAVFINKAGREMLDIGETEDISSTLISDTLPGWTYTLVTETSFPMAIRDGKWSGEIAMLSRSGIEIPVLAVIIVHKTPDGIPQFLSFIAHDITDLKNAESEKILMQQEILNQKIEGQKKIARAIIRGQEKERNYIGQELHDNINQMLAGTKMFLGVAGSKSKEAKEIIRYPMELIDNLIQEIRLLTHKLVTPLKNVNLDELIQNLLNKFNQNSVKTTFTYTIPDQMISDDLKLNIYRIIQEQENNIMKYAEAKNVHISLEAKGNNIIIKVEDDGYGFDVNSKRNGIGISNIINRAETFNGTAKIESSPGNGCKIHVSIPY